jgi:hypothetical protein
LDCEDAAGRAQRIGAEGGGAVGQEYRGFMIARDRQARWEYLRARGEALTVEFDAVKRDHEAGLMPYVGALARHKAISSEMRTIADEMRDLVPE